MDNQTAYTLLRLFHMIQTEEESRFLQDYLSKEDWARYGPNGSEER